MGWNRLIKRIYDIITYPIIPPAGKSRSEVIAENDLRWYQKTGSVDGLCDHDKEDKGKVEEKEETLCKSMLKQILFETGCRMECRAAFEVGRSGGQTGRFEDPWAKKIRLGNLVLQDFYSLKATEGKLIKKLHAGGSDVCLVGVGRNQKYGDVLHLHSEIPTFDSFDRQSDSYHDVYFLCDGRDIHFLYVKGGYSIAWIGAGIAVTKADSQLLEWFQKAGFFVDSLQRMD